MRTASWILTPALVFGLVACGDDGNTDSGATGTSTNMTTGNNTTTGDMTTGNTTTGMTSSPTTGMTTNPTTGTTDDTTGSTTDMTTGMTGTTGGGALTCDAYCALYKTGCADFKEYDNDQACLDQCAQWPVGEANATDGDSLGCRLYHVTVANMSDPNVHCPHASPSGGGVCADPAAPTCADYCTTYQTNCKADLNVYVDEADCLDQCSHWYQGVKDETSGDTVGCRLYHAGAPAVGDPNLHCPHAGPGGGGVCVTP